MSFSPDQLQADRNLRFADWGDLQFQPVIERDGELYDLPRPVFDISLKDTWDSERFKTLLFDGDTVVGSTRNGVDFSVTGEIGSPPDASPLTSGELFAALLELQTKLHVGPDDAKYRFYFIRDAETSMYRYVQSCTTVRMETDLSNVAAFRYRIEIHAEDPTIYAA